MNDSTRAVEHPDTADHTARKRRSFGRNLGIAAFMFFLVKGLVWLAIGAGFITAIAD